MVYSNVLHIQEDKRQYVPEMSTLFELGARAEAMPLTITDYRDMLVLLRKMSALSVHDRLPQELSEVCVCYVVLLAMPGEDRLLHSHGLMYLYIYILAVKRMPKDTTM